MRHFDSDAEIREWLREICVLDSPVTMPDPNVIWKRAEILRRSLAEQAALRPVQWMELFAAVACAAGALIVLTTR